MSLIRWLSAGAIAGFTASGAMVADFRVTYAAENDANQLLSEAYGIFKPLPNGATSRYLRQRAYLAHSWVRGGNERVDRAAAEVVHVHFVPLHRSRPAPRYIAATHDPSIGTRI